MRSAISSGMDHANSMIARDEQTLQGFMTVYMESERDEIDEYEDMEKNLEEGLKSLENIKLNGQSFGFGFTQ